MPNSQKSAVERYLCTGEHDSLFGGWPGESFIARMRQGDLALRGALISLVKSRTGHAIVPEELVNLDVASFTRTKVGPMVRGLFPKVEHQSVLDVLARSVVFLTPATIEPVLSQAPYLETAWSLSNLYLASCGAKLLKVRRREWLLDIDFGKRETFAYACEVYSRILDLGSSVTARRELLSQVENAPSLPDDRVVASEYINILRSAVAARNGWKQILRNCEPPRTRGATSKSRTT